MRQNTPESQQHTRTLSAALQLRCGTNPIDPNASEAIRRQQAESCERADAYVGEPLFELARQCLRIEQMPEPRNRRDMVRSAFSTAALASVLTDSVTATVAEGFDATPDSTAGWTSEVDRNSFKTAPAVVLGSADKLDPLPSGGQADSARVGGDAEQYAVGRFAKRFAIDDQDFVSDNLGALIGVPKAMGLAAAELRPDLIYTILLGNETLDADSVALFDAAAHVNLDSTVLSADAIESGIARIAKQKEKDRDLNLRVTHLIVPSALKITAANILHNAQLDEAENIVLRTDARLDNGVTDPRDGTEHSANGAQWFLSAGSHRTIEVGFLSGTNRRPVVVDWMRTGGKWGIGFGITYDIGAKALDYRALYKSTGAA